MRIFTPHFQQTINLSPKNKYAYENTLHERNNLLTHETSLLMDVLKVIKNLKDIWNSVTVKTIEGGF